LCAFDVAELHGDFAPQKYIDAITEAEKAGYDVLVIDSLSHAWMGSGGALEMVDNAARRSKSGNSYAAWREVTPHHNRLVESMLSARLHIIVTMRTKTEYVIETDSRGKQVPRKIGLAPVQRDGLDYEFDVVLEIDRDHVASVDKTRCSEIADKTYPHMSASGECVAALRTWLSSGAAPVAEAPSTPPPSATPPAPEPPADPEAKDKATCITRAWETAKHWGCDSTDWQAYFRNKGFDSSKAAPLDMLKRFKASLENKAELLDQLANVAGADHCRDWLQTHGGIINCHIDDIRAALTEAVRAQETQP
jgi:hypothetical protein